jgi:hypothetical protein
MVKTGLKGCKWRLVLIEFAMRKFCTKVNPKFFKNLTSKYNTLKVNFWKKHHFISQNCDYFIRENFQKLCQNVKGLLWKRP